MVAKQCTHQPGASNRSFNSKGGVRESPLGDDDVLCRLHRVERGAPLPAEVFRSLQKTYPDSLFIPEESNLGDMGASIPYSAPNLSSAPKFAPVTWRYTYPTGAIAAYLANCSGTCWSSNADSFGIGQKVGDIAIYGVPSQMSPELLGAIEGMILNARSEAGNITVIDTSTKYTHTYMGSPATTYAYPLKMRVYFSQSASSMPDSSVFCENGGLLGTSTCNLNLSGLIRAQVRYYDFAGKLVKSENPIGR